jgi:hypothetical protein
MLGSRVLVLFEKPQWIDQFTTRFVYNAIISDCMAIPTLHNEMGPGGGLCVTLRTRCACLRHIRLFVPLFACLCLFFLRTPVCIIWGFFFL